LLLVILLGVSVLLPLTAAAAAQVTGFISTCGGPATPVPGAIVTLVDANGIAPPATATTDGGGVYIFAGPPPASYTITANQSAYYGAESGTPVRFDGSVTKRIDILHGQPLSRTLGALRARPEFQRLLPRLRRRRLALQPPSVKHEPLAPHSRDRDCQLFPV